MTNPRAIQQELAERFFTWEIGWECATGCRTYARLAIYEILKEKDELLASIPAISRAIPPP